jgi:hypothetical protein
MSGGREALEGDLAAVGEVGIQVEAIEEGGAEKRALAKRENGDAYLDAIPNHYCPVDSRGQPAIIGEIGTDPAYEGETQRTDGRRRERQGSCEPGVHNEFDGKVPLARNAQYYLDPRLKARHVAGDHGAIRVSVPPIAIAAS